MSALTKFDLFAKGDRGLRFYADGVEHPLVSEVFHVEEWIF
jgi:hypothetical protein